MGTPRKKCAVRSSCSFASSLRRRHPRPPTNTTIRSFLKRNTKNLTMSTSLWTTTSSPSPHRVKTHVLGSWNHTPKPSSMKTLLYRCSLAHSLNRKKFASLKKKQIREKRKKRRKWEASLVPPSNSRLSLAKGGRGNSKRNWNGANEQRWESSQRIRTTSR